LQQYLSGGNTLKLTALSLIFFSIIAVGCSSGTNSAVNISTTNAVANSNQRASTDITAVNSETTKGHDLYVKNCAECHKESGAGGEAIVDGKKIKADNLTDDRRKKLTDEKMVKVMVEGIEDEGMPSYKDKLSEAEMREIVRYIRVNLQKLPADKPYANSANSGQ
jgi:mono/diheme cytochrome c family protein